MVNFEQFLSLLHHCVNLIDVEPVFCVQSNFKGGGSQSGQGCEFSLQSDKAAEGYAGQTPNSAHCIFGLYVDFFSKIQHGLEMKVLT